MKEKIILEMLPKLKELNIDNLKKVDTAVDACSVVQALQNKSLKSIV